MNIYGYRLTEKQLNTAINFMKAATKFWASDVKQILIDNGVPKITTICRTFRYPASIATNRLIQELRKQGKIKLKPHSEWEWIDAGKKDEKKVYCSDADCEGIEGCTCGQFSNPVLNKKPHLACDCLKMAGINPDNWGEHHHKNCPKYKTEKFVHLSYYEDAVNAWVPAPDKIEEIISAGDQLEDGDTIEIQFKRCDMTDEEIDSLPVE